MTGNNKPKAEHDVKAIMQLAHGRHQNMRSISGKKAQLNPESRRYAPISLQVRQISSKVCHITCNSTVCLKDVNATQKQQRNLKTPKFWLLQFPLTQEQQHSNMFAS